MSLPMVWWIAAAVLVGLELLTGTLYLLMLALGLAAGALAANTGLPLTAQIVTAALVGGFAVVLMLKFRPKASTLPTSANQDVNIDVGSVVQVAKWSSEGVAQVKHRGALWSAVAESTEPAKPGRYVIAAVVGNQLVLRPAPTSSN